MRLTDAVPPRVAMNARRSISSVIERLLMKSLRSTRDNPTLPGALFGVSATIGRSTAGVNNSRQACRGRGAFVPGAVTVWLLTSLVAAVLLRADGPPESVSSPPMTEARVRVLTRQAQKEARGEATALVLALDRHVRKAWGDFETFPISIVRREDLIVTLSAPFMSYRMALGDLLRAKRPIKDAAWTDAAVVSVTPMRLDGPDVGSVVLTRDERAVAPIRNRLRVMTFLDGRRNQGVLHAGDVYFPPAAFVPGAHVTLTVAPAAGDPFVYMLSDQELATLK
jgi:hypothetical protein